LDFDLPAVDKLVDQIGSQLAAVESVVDLGKKYQGIVVARVVKCEPHPDADRLHVCKIDDGGKVQSVARDENGFVQVVCGAPKVRAGLTVVWIPPGAIVPDSFDKDVLTIESREIRGQTSHGMLASPKELSLSEDHEGLLELDENIQPGAAFGETYGLNDYIIDLENKMFTHRPDCFGVLGVAREVAGISTQAFKNPDWYQLKPTFPAIESEALKLDIKNELPDVVPRFCAAIMDGVEVKASPSWLQSRLSCLGVRPINNVVDLTNYYMLLTGQPLHAYDYDKVVRLSDNDQATALVARYPSAGENLRLLGGKEIELREKTIIIATNKQAIGIGGIMGGSETEVDSNTKRIIIECANFDMYSVRRASMAYGLFTDAATRFTKGQSPLQNPVVLAKITADLRQAAGAKVASPLLDNNHLTEELLAGGSVHPPVSVSVDFINSRLGLKLSSEEIRKLLENVLFSADQTGEEMTIKAPFWRTDIESAEDVVEEVGRLYGYDKLPLELPRRDLTPAPKDRLLTAKAAIRAKLAKAGASEVLNYSFVHGNLLDKVGQDRSKALKIANALSPDLQYYRLSLVPSLLDRVHANIKAGFSKFALFEIGKTHTLERPATEDGLPVEDEITALVVAADDKMQKKETAYYLARKYLVNLVGQELDFKPILADTPTFAIMQPYLPGRSALVSLRNGGKFLGIIGEFKAEVADKLKIPKYCAGFEIDTAVLSEAWGQQKVYSPLPKYPKVEQDISLKVPSGLAYQELYEFLWTKIRQEKPENTLIVFGPLDIYQREDDKDHKQISFRLNIASYEKTLTAEVVNAFLDRLSALAGEKYGAERL
jgi:phenylalanyl-tRNA synthetase beta chain